MAAVNSVQSATSDEILRANKANAQMSIAALSFDLDDGTSG